MPVTDLSLVTPDYSLGEAAWFFVVLLVAVLLPGHALRRQLALPGGSLWWRWALAGVLGVLWTSGLYLALAAWHAQSWHTTLSPFPWLVHLLCVRRRWRTGLRRAARLRLLRAGAARPILAGLLLAATLAAGYFLQTAALVRHDATGLRLYGAFYSDKLTNMSPCAALRQGVPPAALRISGYVFPSHYFPHLFAAAFDVGAGIDYLDGFWFYVAAFGVFVHALAVLAFSRRLLGSPWLACLALGLYGLWRFVPQDKTLDLSFPLLMLAIVSLDLHRCSHRRRWLVLAVALVAAMPCYEVFTCAAALGGFVVWAAVSLATTPAQAAVRWAVAIAACLGAVLAVRMLYLGAELETSPELKFKNVYRESYRHEWRDRLLQPDPPEWIARIYAWKRGKPVSEVSDLAGDREPGFLQRLAGEVVYNAGFVAYFLLRFVNLALFGLVALVARHREKRWTPAAALIASIAAVGFAVPCAVVWGHTADGQWWETPNIYRLTTCAWMLLTLVGVGTLVRAVCQFRRSAWWLPLALAAWQVWGTAVAYVQPATSFHHVPRQRLEALAFLRTHVPPGQVVLHPWIDDLIRNDAQPGQVPWVYKRHFTLGSNLAGCQMFYEGREDHLFINGFVTAEEVYRRRRLRDRFYRDPDDATVRDTLDGGNVRWVVADGDSPPPRIVADSWRLRFRSGNVRVYGRD
ncbi:MAG: hypothetical protein ACYC6Y_02015 [Thermoguttaceae bacterium]